VAKGSKRFRYGIRKKMFARWRKAAVIHTVIKKKYSLSMHKVTVAITDDSYIFRLQSSDHQAVHIQSTKGNYVSVVHI
jgi:hypothetical protein